MPSLKDRAMEILRYLSTKQLSFFKVVKYALEKRFGHQHQAEAYRA